MNAGVWACGIAAAVFIIFGILFLVLKEKGARLISGFGQLSKAEREKYDGARLARDTAKTAFIQAGIMLIGAAAAYFISTYCAIAAFAAWFITFICDIKTDPEKAFEKYLKK